MAAGLISYDVTVDVACFALDSSADIADCPTLTEYGKNNLANMDPVKIGSQAIDMTTGDIYFLKSDDAWHVL